MRDYHGSWEGYILRCDNCDDKDDVLYRVNGEDLCFDCMLDEWAKDFVSDYKKDEFLDWLDAKEVVVEEEEE